MELIVIDDCSKDGTLDILEANPQLYQKLLKHDVNQGKGAALRTGIAAATGDIVIIQDADMEYDPRDYSGLIEPILRREADAVFGSRFMGSGPHRVVYFWHMVGNRFLTLLSNMLTNINLTDMETCYKVFRKEGLDSMTLVSDQFTIEPEMTAKVARGRWRVYEVGISYAGRDYDEGKKITWRDGVAALWAIFRFRFG